MGWQDRIKTAAYVSPRGVRTEFKYTNVSREMELRGSQFSFVDTEGTYIQGTGASGRSFPFDVIITGDDYDIAANRFFDSLREAGIGTLEHPIYGTVDVVPLGVVTQVDNLTTAANQAVFRVTFWETIGALFPSGIVDLVSQLLSSVFNFNSAVSGVFENLIDLNTQIELISIVNQSQILISQVQSSLTAIAAVRQNVTDRFEDIFDGMSGSLIQGAFDPSSFPGQLLALTQSPARSDAPWSDKIAGYGEIISAGVTLPIFTPERDARSSNAFLTVDLSITAAITALVVSTTTTTFTTRGEAITAAQDMLALADDVNTWRELNYVSLGIVGDGVSYRQWREAVALAAGYLIELSFNLVQERAIILDGPRSIVDLTGELYGTIDDKIDFLISSNNITGDEIIEGLPTGRKIKYYV